jgi:betaine-aldehyde dehydrogenase
MSAGQTPLQHTLRERSGHLWIANEYVASSGKRTAVSNPATDEIIGEFAHATAAEVDAAVAVANRAQREWWAMSALDRANAMHQIADRMLAI